MIPAKADRAGTCPAFLRRLATCLKVAAHGMRQACAVASDIGLGKACHLSDSWWVKGSSIQGCGSLHDGLSIQRGGYVCVLWRTHWPVCVHLPHSAGSNNLGVYEPLHVHNEAGWQRNCFPILQPCMQSFVHCSGWQDGPELLISGVCAHYKCKGLWPPHLACDPHMLAVPTGARKIPICEMPARQNWLPQAEPPSACPPDPRC